LSKHARGGLVSLFQRRRSVFEPTTKQATPPLQQATYCEPQQSLPFRASSSPTVVPLSHSSSEIYKFDSIKNLIEKFSASDSNCREVPVVLSPKKDSKKGEVPVVLPPKKDSKKGATWSASKFRRLGERSRVETCASCSKPVHLFEQIAIDNMVFHPSCFKCDHCAISLNLTNYCPAFDGTVRCKAHSTTSRGKIT